MKKSDKTRKDIYAYIQNHPGTPSIDIAESLQVSRVTVYNHIQHLKWEHLIFQEGIRTNTRYYPASELLPDIFPRKEEIIHIIEKRTHDEYGEDISPEAIKHLFQRYCLFIDREDQVFYGIEAFILWCSDSRHNLSSRLLEKAYEYFTLIGSIEFRRKKHGFFDVTESARMNLEQDMAIGFDVFLFHDVFVLPDGYGRTRVALELAYGKQNSDETLLREGITPSLDDIRRYVSTTGVDSIIYTPPTQGRSIQFRDVLEKYLALPLWKIKAEKEIRPNKILQAQKNIRDRSLRIKNALGSIMVDIPSNLMNLKHICILDDSFTTGATPNAIAIKLRNAGFTGKITIITICGSFSYNTAITDIEI